jgi:Zn-dependent metalloprotease
MIKRILMISVIFLLGMTFVLGAAVDVTGNWELTTKMKKGEKKIAYEFVQAGEKLTAVMKKAKGKSLEGQGSVKGDKIEWTMTRKNKKGVAVFAYSGMVEGDTMKGELVIERDKKKGKPIQWSGKRTK